MKCSRTIGIATALLATSFLLGCSGEKPEDSSNATAAAPAQAVTQTDATASNVQASTPTEAVTTFLEALRGGDKTTTENLLTTKARQETASHDLIVEPPGAPGATYTVGRVQHEEGAAYVSCVWAEKEDNTEFEVVWILREENVGWRIAGMATQLADYDEPIILNFEDLSELDETVSEAELAERPAAGNQGQPASTLR